MEKEWNEAQKNKKKFGEREDFTIASDSESDDDQLPFACAICRGGFTDPVMTRCGHYFCESCALNRARKTAKCFVCEENTNGIFNAAPKIVAKMKERREKGGGEGGGEEKEGEEGEGEGD